MVALPTDGTIQVPICDTVLNSTCIIGSIVGTRRDLREVFRPHAAGRTGVIYETGPLHTVNESIAEVLNGQIKASTVLEM